jgi:uncharacterized protein (TIGR00251 family)
VKIRLNAPPVDGKANEELLRFLKTVLKKHAQKIELIRGEKSSLKDIFILGAKLEEIQTLFNSS